MGGHLRGSLAALSLGVLGVALLRRSLLVVEVAGSSMEPTLAGGARLLAVRGLAVRRGHIVVLKHPDRARPPGSSAYLVKRVAAVPGDPVPREVRAVAGVDVVPPGQCVVLGDGAGSVDSRVWGFVPRSGVVGRVVRVLSAGSAADGGA